MEVQEIISVLSPSKTNNWPGLTQQTRTAVNEFIEKQYSSREFAYLYSNLKFYLGFKSKRTVKKFIRKIMDKIFIKCVYESRSYAATSTFLRKI